MAPEENREASLRRRRIALSAVAIAFGTLMLAAIPTDFGPSLLVGLVFGVSFIVYGGAAIQGFEGLRSVRTFRGIFRT
jgi:uncharacterized membrane protein HdeD (DUF308 family)